MRVVGGKFAGRTLAELLDSRVRPTAEPVREAIFALIGDEVKGKRTVDFFAGTGAMGLEAISRGALSCDFVETRASSLHTLKSNIGFLRLKDTTRVFKKDALPFAAKLGANSYGVAFADPPYGSRMLDRLIDTWLATEFAPLLVVEYATGHKLPVANVTKVLGETTIAVYRVRG